MVVTSYSLAIGKKTYVLPVKDDQTIIIYTNNKKVKFDGRPSEEDIREAAIKNNFPIFNQTILGRREIISNIESLEAQGASENEIQEYLDSLGPWELGNEVYLTDRYTNQVKIIFPILAFLVCSIVFWLLRRIFFYVFVKEKFFKL